MSFRILSLINVAQSLSAEKKYPDNRKNMGHVEQVNFFSDYTMGINHQYNTYPFCNIDAPISTVIILAWFLPPP